MPNNPLYNIPGYGAYRARKDQLDAEPMQQLQQAGALLALKNQIDSQKAAAAQSEMFAQSGGDLGKAMEAALRTGNLDAASKIARVIETQRSATAPKGYGPGTQLIGPDGKVVHQVPFAPVKPETAPNEVRLVEFYNGLPDTDPRKPLIKKFIEAKTRPPESTPPVLQTPEGVFERRPEGLKRLTDPQTQAPLSPPSKAAEGLTPENAGKVAMAQQSRDAISSVRSIIFDKNGKMDRSVVAAMSVPFFSGLPGSSNARTVRSKMYNAIEAKLRLETGAAATTQEVERIAQRFLPTIADTDESAATKLNDLDKFFETSLSLTKGIPNTKPVPAGPSVDDLLKKYGGS